MCEFRKLKSSELQCKCTDTKFKGSATILIYKDARVDQRVLDETVGPMRWQKDYKEIDGKIYCGVAIKDKDTGEWIWKWDCGTEGNFEAEKSEASDAFKRACFNWGLGRELYDTPKIKIKCPDSYYYNDKLTMTFTVHEIVWDGDRLESLIIVDRNGQVVYDFHWKDEQKNGQSPTQSNYDLLVEFCKKAKANGADQAELTKYFKFYENKVKEGWKGTFNAETLFNKWMERSKKTYTAPSYNDSTIQDYDERTYGADDQSFYY